MATPECPFPYCDDRLKRLDSHVERLDGDLRALLQREAASGVTIMEMSRKIDWLVSEYMQPIEPTRSYLPRVPTRVQSE